MYYEVSQSKLAMAAASLLVKQVTTKIRQTSAVLRDFAFGIGTIFILGLHTDPQ